MWQEERKTSPESVLSTFLCWVLFLAKCLFCESLEIKFCQVSTLLSCISGPLCISQSTKSLCLFNKRQAETKNWSTVPENLDFIPSIHFQSSLSLSGIYLEGKQLHKEVKFSLLSPKQPGALENAISRISVSCFLSKMAGQACCILLHTKHCKVVKRVQCLTGRLSKCEGDFQFERLIVRKGWKGEALGRCFSHVFIKTFMPPFISRNFQSTDQALVSFNIHLGSCKAVHFLLQNTNVWGFSPPALCCFDMEVLIWQLRFECLYL